MKTAFRKDIRLVVGALCFLIVVSSGLGATTIFDNTTHDSLIRLDPGTTEVGDEIVLAGPERLLTKFSFEYWGTNTANPTRFSGDVKARVRFYENTGALFNGYHTPDNSFYDSGWFSVNPTERATLVFEAGVSFPSAGLFIPVDEMTWTVEFTGMDLTDSVGLDIYSPPTVGHDYPDYWACSGGWLLLTNDAPMDFAARMDAIVPEPSPVGLSLLGGLLILLAACKLRRAA